MLAYKYILITSEVIAVRSRMYGVTSHDLIIVTVIKNKCTVISHRHHCLMPSPCDKQNHLLHADGGVAVINTVFNTLQSSTACIGSKHGWDSVAMGCKERMNSSTSF